MYSCKICGNSYNKDYMRVKDCCPNCYHVSRRIKERPTKDTLIRDIKELGYCGTGRKYGVSDNAIRKWLKY